MQDLDSLAQRLGWDFQDRSLLFHSLVHRSYLNENPGTYLHSNERLEFLGDAILDALAAEFLFLRCPEMGEGDLTLWRSALVRTETLASFSAELDLGRYLVMGRGEETDGGRTRTTILADAFEAVLGAVYLDGGIEATRAFFTPFMEAAMTAFAGHLPVDYKSALQMEVQGRSGITPQYRTAGTAGPDHARVFQVEVWAGDRLLGSGEGPSKQAAQQDAARAALEALQPAEAPAAVRKDAAKKGRRRDRRPEPSREAEAAPAPEAAPALPKIAAAVAPAPTVSRAAEPARTRRTRAARRAAEAASAPLKAAEPAALAPTASSAAEPARPKRTRAARRAAQAVPVPPKAAEPAVPAPMASRTAEPARPKGRRAAEPPSASPQAAEPARPKRTRAARKAETGAAPAKGTRAARVAEKPTPARARGTRASRKPESPAPDRPKRAAGTRRNTRARPKPADSGPQEASA